MTPQSVRDAFAEIFAEMDAAPRLLAMKASESFEIGLERGEPVFSCSGASAAASFRGRWLAEHPVPAAVRPGTVIRFLPASGNRVRVRIAGFFERIAAVAAAWRERHYGNGRTSS